MTNSVTKFCIFRFLGIVVFEQSEYTVNEGDSVTICLFLLQSELLEPSELSEPTTVFLATVELTAIGELP